MGSLKLYGDTTDTIDPIYIHILFCGIINDVPYSKYLCLYCTKHTQKKQNVSGSTLRFSRATVTTIINKYNIIIINKNKNINFLTIWRLFDPFPVYVSVGSGLMDPQSPSNVSNMTYLHNVVGTFLKTY